MQRLSDFADSLIYRIYFKQNAYLKNEIDVCLCHDKSYKNEVLPKSLETKTVLPSDTAEKAVKECFDKIIEWKKYAEKMRRKEGWNEAG